MEEVGQSFKEEVIMATLKITSRGPGMNTKMALEVPRKNFGLVWMLSMN